MKKGIIGFFDKLEDKIRAKLSRHPIIYSLIGSVGIILLWRGIWMTADRFDKSGIFSVIIGLIILMSTGLLVSFFVGEQIIISGIKKGKRIDEKTEEEIQKEMKNIEEIRIELENSVKTQLEEINKKFDKISNDIKNISLPPE